MDPPWPEKGGGKIKRGADKHYPVVPIKDMYSVIALSSVWEAEADSHLYMWVTNTYLPDGLRLMRDLDFRYVTNLAWFKDRAGLGQYFRGKHELCLFGVRGSGYATCTDRRDIVSTIECEEDLRAHIEGDYDSIKAPRTRHSEKPEVFRELVEARSKGPYLEMFCRTPRPGWSSWGNEVPDANV